MDVRDPTTSVVRVAGPNCSGVARLRGEVSPETRARSRRRSRGSGKDSDALRVTRWTQSWAQRRCRAAQRRRGPAPVSNHMKNRARNGDIGIGGLLTSRGNSGAPEQWQGRRDASGRRQRASAARGERR
jgi:hypothetical protein